MNALSRTMREPIEGRWGDIGYNMKLQMLLLRWEVIMKNKTKWELSALVSSRSLGERTDVESQINGLYLTWCRHYNTVLGSKRCIRRTQCHQDALWRYVFLSACSCTGSKKISTWAKIQMVNRGDASCTSNLHARTSLPSAFSCQASHWLWYDIIFVGQRECVSSEYFSEGCLPRTRTGYLVRVVQFMLISWKLHSLLSVC